MNLIQRLKHADAHAGVPLANKLNAPLLLTNTGKLNETTLAEIKRLQAKNVVILSGEAAIGADVEKALKAEGLSTERIAGKTRFSTATAIAEKLAYEQSRVSLTTRLALFFLYALVYKKNRLSTKQNVNRRSCKKRRWRDLNSRDGIAVLPHFEPFGVCPISSLLLF